MHTEANAQALRERAALLTDPNSNYWFDRGVDAYGRLVELMGETRADEWYDAFISDEDTCQEAAELMETKERELVEAALSRPDWDSIEYKQP